MTEDKVIMFKRRDSSPSVELLNQQYSLMEDAIRTKLLESFLLISQEILPLVTELARMLDESLKQENISISYLTAFLKSQSLQEMMADFESLMLSYHKIIVGRSWSATNRSHD